MDCAAEGRFVHLQRGNNDSDDKCSTASASVVSIDRDVSTGKTLKSRVFPVLMSGSYLGYFCITWPHSVPRNGDILLISLRTIYLPAKMLP